MRVPARYVPPDALATVAEAAGARTATALPRGSQVTASRLQGARRDRPAGALRGGERAIELAVSGGEALAAAPPGARVDVIVSSERGSSGGRSVLALEGVELLGVRPLDGGGGDGGEGAAAAATALATLRVTRAPGGLPGRGGELRERGAAAGPAARRPRPRRGSRGGRRRAVRAPPLAGRLEHVHAAVGAAQERPLGHAEEEAVLDHARLLLQAGAERAGIGTGGSGQSRIRWPSSVR